MHLGYSIRLVANGFQILCVYCVIVVKKQQYVVNKNQGETIGPGRDIPKKMVSEYDCI